MIQPLITIITVVYNGVSSIGKTIRSVIGQTYPAIEYIIIDGGSTDGSVEIITNYETKFGIGQLHITKWLSERDTGLYNAMNKGVKMATGEWICFLNSGDVFVDRGSVQKIVQAMQDGIDPQSPAIFYGNILIQNADGTYREKIAQEPCNSHRMYFCHQSAFVKTSLLHQYPFDERHRMSADLKFFKQCYYDDRRFFHANFPVVIYDTSGISNTQRQSGLRDNIAVIKSIDKGFDKYKFLLRLYFTIYWRKLTGKS
ncbi:glycosyl transferase [Bacteroidia bacterium]|nr:glycosyl transferase [Bacteroidia bacterium]